jgi:hypothetical protein
MIIMLIIFLLVWGFLAFGIPVITERYLATVVPWAKRSWEREGRTVEYGPDEMRYGGTEPANQCTVALWRIKLGWGADVATRFQGISGARSTGCEGLHVHQCLERQKTGKQCYPLIVHYAWQGDWSVPHSRPNRWDRERTE